jgi:hypothetical protein
MKKSEFENEIKKMYKEGLLSTVVNPGHGELDKYLSKVDKVITNTIKSCNDLIEEGEELMEEDILRLPQVGERNRMILEMIGILRKLKSHLVNIPTQTRQKMG